MNTTTSRHRLPMLFIAASILALPSCQHFGQFGKETKDDMQRFWMDETNQLPIDRSPTPTIDSNNPADFINKDGTGTAIPAKAGYNLYLSPFAPTAGYVESRLPEGSWVRCPFTGKRLKLGSRDVIAEKELP